MRRFALLASLGALLCSSPSWGQAPTCHATAEEAAQAFVQRAIDNPSAAPELLAFQSLASYRARLEQLLDDRYSPDSGAMRSRLLGGDTSLAEMRSMSHSELVGKFMSAGAAVRAVARLSDVVVTGAFTHPYLGHQVAVSYRITTGSAATTQERTFSTSPERGCWKLQMPVEAWARLEQIAGIFKASRVEPQFKARGGPMAALRIAPASASPFASAKQFKPTNASHAAAWVADSPLLTEKDLVGVSASWDCNAGLGPEDPVVRLQFSEHGTAVLSKWSQVNMGSMLAVVIDGEVRTFARVAATLGSRLSVCLPRTTLADAESLARRLAGVKE